MNKDILVTILEDDVFSRNWMALLMVRDWRTRLVGEFNTRVEFCQFLESTFQPFDILILDVDLFGENFTISEICDSLTEHHNDAKILLTGIQPESRIIDQMDDTRVCGYVLKHEVGYSLSWVITFAYDGHWIFTPGTMSLAVDMNHPLPENKLVLDGRKHLPGFTEHEAEVARFAFIFSLGRRDLADELKISEQWSYGLVSELYEKMGLSDIISGEVDLFSYIGESEIIRSHFTEIMAQLGSSKKARDLETLAYHLITMPEIVE
jgi:DNA-binding NarL/FixJ family response regulator